MFDGLTFFDDARITFYVGMFIICTEITLQLRFVRFFHTSQFCYLSVQYSYGFLMTLELRYFGMFELSSKTTLQNGYFLVKFVCTQKMTKNYVIFM